MITITEFKNQLLNLTNDELEDMTDRQLIEYLNQAMLTRYQELIMYAPSVYKKKGVITFTGGTTAPLPSDMNEDLTASYLLYYDGSYAPYDIVGGREEVYWLSGGTLEFDYAQASGTTYNISYTKAPTYFDPSTVDVAVDTIPESASPRALAILKREVEALWHSADNEGEQTPSSYNAQIKANRLS